MSLVDKHYEFVYPLNVNTVLERVMSVARSVKGLYFSHFQQPGSVVLKSSASLWSWGETVTVECRFLDPNRTLIHISSVPALATTLIDWGKGQKNIDRVLEALRPVLPPTGRM